MAKTQGRRGSDREGPKLASRSELNALLTKLARRHPSVEGEHETERYEAIRASRQKLDREKLQALVRRAFYDSLKSPSQQVGTARPAWREADPRQEPNPT